MRVDRDLTVVIPYSGDYRYLRLCLAGLRYQTLHPPHTIIVHDNCDIREESYETGTAGKILCNHTGEKGNRSAVRNIGIEMATTDWVLLIDEDIILLSNYFENLQKLVDDNRNRVIHGSLLNKKLDLNLPEEQILKYVDTDGQKALANSTAKSTVPSNRWQSFCTGNLTVSRELLIRAGLFDEKMSGWGEEDTEMGFRVGKAGGIFENRLSIRGVHIVKPSINTRERNKNWHKNLVYALDKHKNEPEYVKARQRCLSFSRRYQ